VNVARARASRINGVRAFLAVISSYPAKQRDRRVRRRGRGRCTSAVIVDNCRQNATAECMRQELRPADRQPAFINAERLALMKKERGRGRGEGITRDVVVDERWGREGGSRRNEPWD